MCLGTQSLLFNVKSVFGAGADAPAKAAQCICASGAGGVIQEFLKPRLAQRLSALQTSALVSVAE